MNRQRVVPAAFVALAASLVAGCDDGPTSATDGSGGGRLYSESETASFAVADSCSAVIETFVGAITVAQSAPTSIEVVTTRRADRLEDLAELSAEASLQDNVLALTATNPLDLRNVSVDFEVTGPPDMILEAHCAVGSILCRGTPSTLWDVGVGVGSIELVIPPDANVRVDLVAGVGSVDVGLPVQGSVSSGSVVGNIGTGADGEIVARCGVGSIRLISSR